MVLGSTSTVTILLHGYKASRSYPYHSKLSDPFGFAMRSGPALSYILGALHLLTACSQTLLNENGVIDMNVLTAHRGHAQRFDPSATQNRAHYD